MVGAAAGLAAVPGPVVPPRRGFHAVRAWALAATLLASAVLAPSAALASRTLYLARDEPLCDGPRTLCIDGTLTYDVNDRLLWLRGRVRATAVPGTLRITVKGTNRLGHVRYAPLEVRLRGRASEIVDFRMIPDHPDVANWAIDRVDFVPDGPKD